MSDLQCEFCLDYMSDCKCKAGISVRKLQSDLATLQAKYDSMNKIIPPAFWEERKAKDEAMEKLEASRAKVAELEAMVERLHNYLPGLEKTTWPHEALSQAKLEAVRRFAEKVRPMSAQGGDTTLWHRGYSESSEVTNAKIDAAIVEAEKDL